MTLSRRPGVAPAPRSDRTDSSRAVGAGEPGALPLSDADIFALVRGTVEVESDPALPVGLTGEALMSAMLDAEIATRATSDRPVTSVFGDVEEVEAEVEADVQQQDRAARLAAARERAEQQAAQREHDEAVGRRWARVRRVTWIAATVMVAAVLAIVGLLALDSRVGLVPAPVAPATQAPTEPQGYQVDPSTVMQG